MDPAPAQADMIPTTVIDSTLCCEPSDFRLNVAETFPQVNIVNIPRKRLEIKNTEASRVTVTDAGQPTRPSDGEQDTAKCP